MIRLVIDVVLLIIIAMCTWQGYRKGLVGGVASILAIIIALFGGSLLSSAYAHEVVPALKPFVDGYIDSQNTRDEVLDEMGYGNSDLSLEDILARDGSLNTPMSACSRWASTRAGPRSWRRRRWNTPRRTTRT